MLSHTTISKFHSSCDRGVLPFLLSIVALLFFCPYMSSLKFMSFHMSPCKVGWCSDILLPNNTPTELTPTAPLINMYIFTCLPRRDLPPYNSEVPAHRSPGLVCYPLDKLLTSLHTTMIVSYKLDISLALASLATIGLCCWKGYCYHRPLQGLQTKNPP